VRFDQPDYSRPSAGNSLCALRVCNNFVRHLLIIAKGWALPSARIAIYSAFFGSSQSLIFRAKLARDEIGVR